MERKRGRGHDLACGEGCDYVAKTKKGLAIHRGKGKCTRKGKPKVKAIRIRGSGDSPFKATPPNRDGDSSYLGHLMRWRGDMTLITNASKDIEMN